MTELTLESLAKRIEALEQKLAGLAASPTQKKDWRKGVGMPETAGVVGKPRPGSSNGSTTTQTNDWHTNDWEQER